MRESRPTVVVVSDHALFREGITALLRERGYQVHDDPNGSRVHADVTIVDLDHAREDTMALVQRVRRTHEQARLVAVGTAIRLAAADEAADVEIETPQRDGDALVNAVSARRQRPSQELVQAHRTWSRVTPRQRDVLRWLAAGFDNSAIGEKLGIGPRAVKAHMSSLLRLFGCESRTQLALFAFRAGVRAPRNA